MCTADSPPGVTEGPTKGPSSLHALRRYSLRRATLIKASRIAFVGWKAEEGADQVDVLQRQGAVCERVDPGGLHGGTTWDLVVLHL